MQKPVSIQPIAFEKRRFIETTRQARLQAKVRMKTKSTLGSSAEPQDVGTPTADDIDPVEFARSFRPFREDMDLLPEDDQLHFQNLLRGYLLGNIDHEVWRRAVSALSELKRAHTPPPPKNYWKRCVSSGY